MHFLFIGVVLGLSAGFSPGPLAALVVSETLRYGTRAGIRVALAPMVTDLPIIFFSIIVLTRLVHSELLLAVVSFCGALFLTKMGMENLRMGEVKFELAEASGRSFRKGVITNFLSPHPYLFWLTVGVPVMGKAMQEKQSYVLLFLASFYFLLVGAKIFMAFLVGKMRNFLSGRIYLYTMRFLGLILCMLAAVLAYDGIIMLADIR